MGHRIRPDFLLCEYGVPCAHGWGSARPFGNTPTPKRIRVKASNIIPCPIAVDPPPNGYWTLLQQANSCQFRYTSALYVFFLWLKAPNSVMLIQDGAGNTWFEDNQIVPTRLWTNEKACGPGDILGEGGTCELSWHTIERQLLYDYGLYPLNWNFSELHGSYAMPQVYRFANPHGKTCIHFKYNNP